MNIKSRSAKTKPLGREAAHLPNSLFMKAEAHRKKSVKACEALSLSLSLSILSFAFCSGPNFKERIKGGGGGVGGCRLYNKL